SVRSYARHLQPDRHRPQPEPSRFQFLSGTRHTQCLSARFRQRYQRARAPTNRPEYATSVLSVQAAAPTQEAFLFERSLVAPLLVSLPQNRSETRGRGEGKKTCLVTFALEAVPQPVATKLANSMMISAACAYLKNICITSSYIQGRRHASPADVRVLPARVD